MLRLCGLLLLSFTHAVYALPAGLSCASEGGSPASSQACGVENASSLGNISGTQLGAGNPINVVNGNKFQKEVDLPALPGVLGLEIIRYYNSVYSRTATPAGLIGRGWRLSYDTEIIAVANGLHLIQADGTRIIFERASTQPHLYTTPRSDHGSIRLRPTLRGNEYSWKWPNGRQLSFDPQGKLTQIVAPTGEFLTLLRDPHGTLTKIVDPQGRTLTFIYLDKKLAKQNDRFGGLHAIDSPVGRFTYHYGSDLPKGSTINPRYLLSNLVKVSLPTHHDANQKMHTYANRGVTASSISRLYHYEDARFPTLLTGISVTGQGSDQQLMNTRMATWHYDDKARAVLSVKGEPARFETAKDGTRQRVPDTGIEQVTLQFLARTQATSTGQTILTNSLGQRTVYTHQIIGGDYRLLEVRGAGCASCGETNVRYRYDEQGRLVETLYLSEHGIPIYAMRTTLDTQGSYIKAQTTERIAYVNGKPLPARLVQRVEYAVPHAIANTTETPLPSHQNPVLMAKPSVVPGKEHQVHITYNTAGQPTRIIETGWSPGLANAPPLQISRTQTYAYRTINGRSLLSEVDGPLPNGARSDPSDSDITRYYYDDRGNQLLRLTQPLNTLTTFKSDPDTGRVTEVTQPDGQTAHYSYHPRGQLTEVSSKPVGQNAVSGMAVLHDAAGRATEWINIVNGKRIPETKAGFDVANRLIWQAAALGILNRAHYDTESRLLGSTAQTSRFKQEEQYRYDEVGRLVAVTDSSGVSHTLTYNSSGQISGVLDPMGRLTRYNYFPTQELAAVTQAANTPQAMTVAYGRNHLGQVDTLTANADSTLKGNHPVTTRVIRDDFGREIVVISPDSGTVSREYDAANRLIKERNALGDTFKYEYDNAGKLLRKTVTSLNTLPVITAYRYQHNRLIEVNHPNQTEQYRYGRGGNGDGRLTTKVTVLKLANGKNLTHTTHYTYNEAGNLIAQTLPDGSTLQYEKNGQGQIIVLARDANRFKPNQTLVSGIERDLIGLKHLTFGNGVQGEWQRSQEGILASVVYTRPDTSSTTQTASFSPFGFLVSSAHAADGTIDKADGSANTPMHSAVAAASPLLSASAKPGALGIPANPNALWDARYLFDASGNMLHQSQHAQATQPKTVNYAYDAMNQLIAAQASSTVSRYWHDNLGNRLLSQENQPVEEMEATMKYSYQNGSHRSETGVFDAAGRPLNMGEQAYTWNADGQLLAVMQKSKLRATYRYNHRGERISKTVGAQTTYYLYDNRQRIAELDEQGRIIRQYIWLADQLVAVIDSSTGKPLALANIEQDEDIWKNAAQWGHEAWSAMQQTFVEQEAIRYVHVNHLGAPVAATNNNGKTVWNADYAPFGKAAIQALNTFALDLRLPGQWEDAETGLYYNDYRYYDPNTGRYLSPDPLGIRGGLNPYGYVQANPLIYSDPLGLILFAFDGTGNSSPAPHNKNGVQDDISNVRKFFLAYSDGKKWYMNGIGRPDPDSKIALNWNHDQLDKDAMYATTGRDRVNFMLTQLDGYMRNGVKAGEQVNIDVIGFSRGAAMARDFTNHVAKRLRENTFSGSKACGIHIRFLGLWDTVAQFGSNGVDNDEWQLDIPAEAKNVFHAVALHEHRYLFPGESISRGIQRGFIGSHADIGGSYATGDLSDVALNWMVEQAKASGVKMFAWDDPQNVGHAEWGIVTNPLLHNKANTADHSGTADRYLGTNPRTGLPDRKFCSRKNKDRAEQCQWQQDATPGGMTWSQSWNFIYHFDKPGMDKDGTSPITGGVNMKEYAKWLEKNYQLPIRYIP